MSQPLISQLNTWERKERGILALLISALNSLSPIPLHDQSEPEINRKLYWALRRQTAGPSYVVMCEANNQPSDEEVTEKERERKRPDIQILWKDTLEQDPLKCQREYIIECKRLGKPMAGRIFTSEYVMNGIKRFVSKNHGYAKGCASGTMVGYIQNMELEDILKEVNTASGLIPLPPLVLIDNWNMRGVSQLEQFLERLEIEPSQFLLKHLWADFRAIV
ncbi:hypothetical protein Psch_02219 [Pelotomaculum schinkii]|uniref:Uncharacterized protein n=1 Tax=Pelotomaculum schinkii TaxID=78350 RepID=A0A4Y7RIW8_9FIRM|nr:hypothetical protein [Pelotomaculum schinkii]TEB08652.1 hypothetical protein Psch_02219 [Pelotomaculum schinkii]